ncbi:MAG TPA: YciI family protein [Gemmatimonadales bacterium]|nr:YciI family protein [Gemmatimonadales bacterium]
MPHYLIAGYLPKDFDPSTLTEAMVEGIHSLNREMVAAGVRRFAGGLGPAHSLRTQPNGEVLVTDGPYLETKELVGGITILEVANLEEALKWARKGAKVARMASEVREIFFMPAPEKG